MLVLDRLVAKASVNNAFYDEYGERWYGAYDDPVALLRAQNRLTTPWIVERIACEPARTSLLDVGCGAGFLANDLAERGFSVTGVDLSETSLAVARRHDRTATIDYRCADAYALPFPDSRFDVVTVMDFLEHVEDPARVIAECSRVLKPGGLFFFHTFNRSLLAGLVVIALVRAFVRNTPRHMHVLRLFIRPAELRGFCQGSGLTVREMVGVRPVLSSIPLASLWRRTVPKDLRFELTDSLRISYLGLAAKAEVPV